MFYEFIKTSPFFTITTKVALFGCTITHNTLFILLHATCADLEGGLGGSGTPPLVKFKFL